MNKGKVKDFANYVVYTVDKNKKETTNICLCENSKIAEQICQTLAWCDDENKTYYYTSIGEPGSFTWGGGWYICWYKNKDGKLETSSLM